LQGILQTVKCKPSLNSDTHTSREEDKEKIDKEKIDKEKIDKEKIDKEKIGRQEVDKTIEANVCDE